MRAINLQGPVIQLSSTSASSVNGAILVRVTHVSDTGNQRIDVTNRYGTNTSSIYLSAQETVYIQKDPSDLILASDASGYMTPVVFVY
jgi:hypothetical protein